MGDAAGRELATTARFAQEDAVSELSGRHCVPSRKGMPRLTDADCARLLSELDDWSITAGPRLSRNWKFADFASALAFVNRIGLLADAEDHHPDVTLGWGRVGVELSTHAADGLTENDFILAAKIDDAYCDGAS